MEQNADNSNGVTYKIQIAASKRKVYFIAKFACKCILNSVDNYIRYNNCEWHKYSVGKFICLIDVKSKLNAMQPKVKDDYIEYLLVESLKNRKIKPLLNISMY